MFYICGSAADMFYSSGRAANVIQTLRSLHGRNIIVCLINMGLSFLMIDTRCMTMEVSKVSKCCRQFEEV
jgi:hypothetical protein